MTRIKTDDVATQEGAIELLVGKLIDFARTVDSGDAEEVAKQKTLYHDAALCASKEWGVETTPYNNIQAQLLNGEFTE